MISIFTNKPPIQIQNIQDDIQGNAAYHFDAIMRYNVDFQSTHTSYPIEFGADKQDHAFIEPTKVVIYGYVGSRELSISLNQLPALGASAVVGRINNPILSAAAGIAASAGLSYLAGSQETRGSTTLDFLVQLQQSFAQFDLMTGLRLIPGMTIDSINADVTEFTETGLDFVVEMSQKLIDGGEQNSALNLIEGQEVDNSVIQSFPVVDRGRIALG